MEQIEGGDLIVNRGDESKPKESSENKRDMNTVEGFDAAVKLAQVCGDPHSCPPLVSLLTLLSGEPGGAHQAPRAA